MKKKFLISLQILMLAVSAFLANGVTALAEQEIGEMSSNGIKYTLMSDNTATVTGCDKAALSEAITIPEKVVSGNKKYTVTRIGDKAFYECSKLISVTLPDSITDIDVEAFCYCTSLKQVNNLKRIETIGTTAFRATSLESISLPSSLKSLGAFVFMSCGNLKTVILEGDVPAVIDNSAFSSCNSGLKIYVQDNYVEKYRTALEISSSMVQAIPTDSHTGEKMAANGQDYYGTCDISDGYYIIRSVLNDNYCLSIENGEKVMSSGGNLEIQPVYTSKTKIFKIEKSKDIEAYSIIAAHSGKYLGLEIGYDTVKEGTNIAQMSDAYGHWNQRWIFYDAGNGQVTCRVYNHVLPAYMDIKDIYATDGQNVYAWTKTGGQNQKWTLEKIDYAPIAGQTATGTESDPYLISTSEQLAGLARDVATGYSCAGKYYKLAESFEYNGAPIGSAGHPFRGIFDGNGKTLTVNITNSKDYTGLFAEINGAVIKNLEIKGSVTGTNWVGGIVGYAYGNSRIENCHVTATVKGNDGNVGGIVGALADSTVCNCRVDATVSGGWTTIGGIVGAAINSCNVVNCVKTGETAGDTAVGGIMGFAVDGDTVIANCASIGNINGQSNCGGIIGLISSDINTIKLYSCYVYCSIQCNDNYGYICGKSEKTESGLEGQHLYYERTGNTDADAYFPSSYAAQITGVRNQLNTFVNDNARIVPGVKLTTWTFKDGKLWPESCEGFNTAYTGYILSEGNLWIVIAGGVVILGSIAAIIIGSKKKKTTI